jgi:glycosyltransferase involved in cell wall biosynthesis
VLGQVFKDKLISLGVPSKTPFFIQTSVADDSFLSNLELQKKIESFDNHVKVLFISRLVKEKGLFIAIDAFDILTGIVGTNFQKLSLTVAGSGPELDKAKSYVVKKSLKNIRFLGYVTGSEKGKLLVQSHILLLPTFYGEGLPCTVLEGMLYGMPVISRNNAGIPDVIKNELNGYLTDSLEPEIFAGFLKDIILDKSKYMDMAIRNHNTGKEQFTSSKVRNRILSAYRSFG